jgi:hypothetical protein
MKQITFITFITFHLPHYSIVVLMGRANGYLLLQSLTF